MYGHWSSSNGYRTGGSTLAASGHRTRTILSTGHTHETDMDHVEQQRQTQERAETANMQSGRNGAGREKDDNREGGRGEYRHSTELARQREIEWCECIVMNVKKPNGGKCRMVCAVCACVCVLGNECPRVIEQQQPKAHTEQTAALKHHKNTKLT